MKTVHVAYMMIGLGLLVGILGLSKGTYIKEGDTITSQLYSLKNIQLVNTGIIILMIGTAVILIEKE